MEICATSEKGQRPKQEDRVFIYSNEKGNIRVFGCFDGHGPDKGGGAVISEALVSAFQEVCKELKEDLFRNDRLFRQFIRANFKHIDEWLLEEFDEIAIESGSTATLGFYESKSNTYYTVNLGDSRTIYFEKDERRPGRHKVGTYGQTLDHKPSDVSEISRIEKAGGTVRTSSDSSKVPRVDGVLALSRAFGDYQLKVPYNESIRHWVSNTPNINGPIHPKGTFYSVSGSDGVFDQMTNAEIMEIVLKPNNEKLKSKCNYIVQESLDRWRQRGGRDNVTCVIFKLERKK